MLPIEIRLLSAFSIRVAGEPVHLETAKTRALLAYLILSPGEQPRPRLVGLLWGELAEARAARNLRRALWDLRRRLDAPAEESLLSATDGCLEFHARPGVWVDAHACQLACHSLEASQPGDDLEALGAALALFSGDVLPGFSLPDAPEFEEWLLVERERLHLQAGRAMLRLGELWADRRNYPQALTCGQRLLALDPWNEAGHRAVMTWLAAGGQRAEALAQYETCRQALARGLGVEPADETRRLYDRLRRGPQASQQPRPARPPAPAAALVGREGELAKIRALLAEDDCRLLTLTGPGGVGKTRLAVQVVAEIDAQSTFPEGVVYIPLAGLDLPQRLAAALADGLGLELSGQAEPFDELRRACAARRMLIVLDNFEHLLPDGAASLEALLQAEPGLKLLVTSRSRLGLAGEWLLELEGLPYRPEAEGTPPEELPAARLFLQAARRANLGFELQAADASALAQICSHVEGLPLALELAAGWVRVLSPAEIAAELDSGLGLLADEQRPEPRPQRNLRRVLDRSWALLSNEERELFKRLAVFAAGFDRQAAQAVAGATPAGLGALVSQSMLRRNSSGRYELHSLLRQFGRERLTAPERQAAALAHSRYYLGFLAGQQARLHGPDQILALQAIAAEMEHIHRAWSVAVEDACLPELAAATESLFQFLEIRCWYRQGEAAFRQAAERVEHLVGPQAEALFVRLLARQALFCECLGWYAQAEALGRRGLDLARRRGDAEEELFCLHGLAVLDVVQNRPAQALARFQDCLRMAQALQDRLTQAVTLNDLGWLANSQGDAALAEAQMESSLALWRELGDRRGIANALLSLADVVYAGGNLSRAGELASAGLAECRTIGFEHGACLALLTLSDVAAAEGNPVRADLCARQAIETALAIGDQHSVEQAQMRLHLY